VRLGYADVPGMDTTSNAYISAQRTIAAGAMSAVSSETHTAAHLGTSRKRARTDDGHHDTEYIAACTFTINIVPTEMGQFRTERASF
jgi:cation transporter-like permease